MDKLSLRQIDYVRQKEAGKQKPFSDESKLYLSVEFPTFRYPVIFHQKYCCNPTILPKILPFQNHHRIIVIHDPEIYKDNPIEMKFQKLSPSRSRSQSQSHLIVQYLNPNICEHKEIQSIIDSPDNHITQEQKLLLWKFRYSLVNRKNALPKVFRCVNWSDPNERQQALNLLPHWSSITTNDALELLGPDFHDKSIYIYIYIPLCVRLNVCIYIDQCQLIFVYIYIYMYRSARICC